MYRNLHATLRLAFCIHLPMLYLFTLASLVRSRIKDLVQDWQSEHRVETATQNTTCLFSYEISNKNGKTTDPNSTSEETSAQHTGCFENPFTVLIERSWSGQRPLLKMQIL